MNSLWIHLLFILLYSVLNLITISIYTYHNSSGSFYSNNTNSTRVELLLTNNQSKLHRITNGGNLQTGIVLDQSINFFPWNDGVDYNEFCTSLKDQFSKFNGPIIIHYGLRGGLGHKTRSVVYSIFHALLTQRPIKCTLLINSE